jgi:SAM-dependent methyltransferase
LEAGWIVDIAHFDTRRYRTVSVPDGYGEWADTYEETVLDLMDLRLLNRLQAVPWEQMQSAADLACGTGRTGAWLKTAGVQAIDGVDLTPAMLERAEARGVYRRLHLGDVAVTPLPAAEYDLVTAVLVDEHLPELGSLYREAARIVKPGGCLVLVGYHPYFLMHGIPTHFDSPSGEPVAIRCYVHLFSDHAAAAFDAGWELREMLEGLIDEAWLSQKPQWAARLHWPVSFALVWQAGER